MLVLPFQVHCISLSLIVCFSHPCPLLFCIQAFVSVGKFLLMNLILFLMAKGSFSLVSLSDFTFFVYRNARGYCGFILHPATSQNSLISSRRFWIASFAFSMYSTMSSEKHENINTSLQIWILFISFSSLIAVAKTSDRKSVV